MSNRRVKNIGYDEDDGYDSYGEDYEEGQDELTEDDKVQMQEGTTKVKNLLGPQFSVTDKEIQDALWHYYYDIDKSVTYLKNLRKPKSVQRVKESSKPSSLSNPHAVSSPSAFDLRLDMEAFQPVASNDWQLPKLGGIHAIPVLAGGHFNFFEDTPWGRVPSTRLGTLSHFSHIPANMSGLLGGSSKLAALAAARKKKEAEKASSQTTSTNSQGESDRSIGLLDRLGKDETMKNDKPTQSKPTVFPTRRKPSPERVPEEPEASASEELLVTTEDIRAEPSVFAQTLMGTEQEGLGGVSLRTSGLGQTAVSQGYKRFELPYMADPKYNDPFSKPSPDDIVTRAQGTGSRE